MSDPVVTLRLNADNSKLLPPVRQSDEAVKRLGATAETTGRQSQQSAAGVNRLGSAADDAGKRASAMASALNVAKTAAMGYGAVQIASGVTRMADSYANMTGRLKLAAAGESELAASRTAVYDISQRTSTQMESTVALYTRLAQSTAEYGYSQQRQLALTESINRTFAISGASAVAASNTITQFTQALAGGTLRAEEFNSVVENSPRLAKALADGMGIGMGELRKQVNDGKVSVEAMMKALEAQSGVIEAEFNQLPLTVERSLVQLRNAVTQAVGQMSEDLGAGSALANGIAFIANHMDLLEKATTVVAVAYSSKLAVAIAQDITARVQSIAAARAQAAAELVVARTAEAHAVARVNLARAGISSAGGLAAAEAGLQAAQARTLAITQASSLALTAKAAAMRGLNTAMAAFGGPVGLAITALTLFVMWTQNSKVKADELSKSVTTGFQAAIEKLEGFNRETANTSFASLSASIETLGDARKDLDSASQSYRELIQAREVWLTRGGAVPAGFNEDLQEASERMQSARLRVDQLAKGYDSAISVAANLVLEQAGLASINEQQRASLERLIERQSKQGQTLQQNIPMLQGWAREQGLVEAANKLASASFDQVGASATAAGQQIKAALQEVDKGLDKQINTLQLQLIEKTQGKAAAMRAGFIKEMAAKGLDPTSAEYQQRRSRNEEVIALTLQIESVEKANKSATQAQIASTRAQAQQTRSNDQARESQARYTAEAALAAAEQQGPLAAAQEQNKQRIAELDKALKAHNITQAAHTTLITASESALKKRQAELDQDIRAPQVLLDAMNGELTVLRQTGLQREITRRQLQAEQDMRRELATAVEAAGSKEQLATKMGAKSYREYEAAMLSAADASAAMSVAMEQSAHDAEDWAAVWGDAVSSVADAFTDFAMSGLKDFEGLASGLKSIAKQLAGDLVRTFLQQKIVVPIQTQITNAMSGTGGGNWMSQLAGMFGSGQGLTATAATNSASWKSSMANSGSMMGMGNNMGGFLGSGAGASGAGMMGSMASIIPIVGWIYAGMQLNNSMYNKGWKLNESDYSWAGAAASPFPDVAVGGAATDKLLQKLGLDAKTSSMITGTATLSALFGRKAPKVQAQGLTGSYGFDSFSGQNYADIKAKGGLFRSDKKWTEYSALDDALQDTFNVAIRRTRTGVTELAKQLGMDITSQLSGVRINLDKVVLDADPEKAKAQMEELLGNMVETLAGKGVGMVGFDQLLNKGFEASDVMFGLSSAIQMVSGSAADLGRSLNAAEIELVGRTVQMFQKMASAAGTTLEEEITAIAGAASSYGGVVATAQQEVATAGFSGFAKALLAVRMEEKERLKTLKDQANALHGLAAREEDLATVRAAARAKTDALVTSLQGELVDLALNRLNDQIEQLGGSAGSAGSRITDFINGLRMSDTLSVDTDATKRTTANDLMNTAALAGDVDSFINYAQQMLEVSRNLNASGAAYRADYDRVLQMASQFGGASSLQELYAQRDKLVAQQEAAARMERAQRIAQGVSDLVGVKGGNAFDTLYDITGMSADELAKDLGLSLTELQDYMDAQQTDIGDLADILYELPGRIAQAMVGALTDKVLPPTAGGSSTPPSTGQSTASNGYEPVLDMLGRLNTTLQRLQVQGDLAELGKPR